MPEFFCCDPSYDPEERTRILASMPAQAAEEYAALMNNPDFYQTVWVYDADGNEHRFVVTRELKPVYTAEPE